MRVPWKTEPVNHIVKLEPVSNQFAIYDSDWSKTIPDIVDWNGKSIHLMKSDFGIKLETDGAGNTPTYNTLSLIELRNALDSLNTLSDNTNKTKYIERLDEKGKKRAQEALQLTQVSLPNNEKWYSIFRYIKDPIQPSLYDLFAQYTLLPNIKDLDHIERTLYYKITNCPTIFDSQNGVYRYIGKLKYSHTRSGIQLKKPDGSGDSLFEKITNTSIKVDRQNTYY